MRKTILVVFVVVMLTTPCIAQEVEPEGLSWIHGTVWRKVEVEKSNIDNSGEMFGIYRGFYDGRVYGWTERYWGNRGSYEGFVIGSFYEYDTTLFGDYIAYSIVEEGILFPLIGIGFVEVSEYIHECMGIRPCGGGWYDPYYIHLIKVNNWWDPSIEGPSFD
jgi:hypothetical protein